MREKLKKYIKEILIFFVLLTVFANALSYYRSLDLNKDKLTLQSVKLLDNTAYTLAKNKPIVLHFWATWCPTCKFEASNIQALSEKYEVISIAVNSGTKEEIRAYLQKHKLSFKVVDDANGLYAKTFNIKVFPTTLIFDKNRELAFSEVGYTSTAGLFSRLALIE